MPTSPSREGTLPPPQQHHSSLIHTDLQPPPSPRTHRALRRLQSAHTLGAKAASHGSLISQHYRDALHRNASPVRNSQVVGSSAAPAVGGNGEGSNGSGARTATPTATSHRGRANSDAISPMMHQMNSVGAARRTGISKPVFSHGHLSLQQIIKEGPNDGDFIGALESARWKVVDEGVKSAEDGMVCLSPPIESIEQTTHH